ncbi:hypothetical protein PHYBLDRAFT_145443 [Phycomyces blakesleeanus NRRL 1555(-)]|uniref:Uncharacterized protein n=1 Tax=Phycomyces blakesleeanus (strain ATCC 8743b / DSM 1359 / FGSC 10004 / NBRC 33097 / NRRL 1555) TaxID=763407 RepID=A0A167MU12_PHYB8|nr:hypothetical protein PHYBLDRAFT_145443 [Phycomyces blakesleeanus NRRL 1555(-)]OAD73979.1 hypothetical protein PHYBLDRAFT_145443 [Phycomyces blakesleeanus NRRL 1555(-)]|eukprot:XP_018292019.1 hypothetical protein PHYBLDRAFT_145443 [Phycomyces blakesleeanus NRRL 1555(-)]
MVAYWYSTDGIDQRRLSNRHLSILDEAFKQQRRVEIYDEDAFGPEVLATACPHLGTMTAGLLHYGLYRQPSLWDACDSSLETLLLMDCGDGADQDSKGLSSDWYENSCGLLDTPAIEIPDSVHSPDHHAMMRTIPQGTNPSSLFSNYQSVPDRPQSHLHDSSYICCIIS